MCFQTATSPSPTFGKWRSGVSTGFLRETKLLKIHFYPLDSWNDSLLSCRGCPFLFITSRSCCVTTVTDRKGRSVILSIITKRLSKNLRMFRWRCVSCSAADACIPAGNQMHDLVFISWVFLTYLPISPTYSQLIAHTVAPMHPLIVRLWLAAGHLIPTLPEAESLERKLTISSSLFAGICAPKDGQRTDSEFVL